MVKFCSHRDVWDTSTADDAFDKRYDAYLNHFDQDRNTASDCIFWLLHDIGALEQFLNLSVLLHIAIIPQIKCFSIRYILTYHNILWLLLLLPWIHIVLRLYLNASNVVSCNSYQLQMIWAIMSIFALLYRSHLQ